MKLFISIVLCEIQQNFAITVTIWEHMTVETGETHEFKVFLIRSCISLPLLSFERSSVPIQKHSTSNLWVLAQMERFCQRKYTNKTHDNEYDNEQILQFVKYVPFWADSC